MAEDISDEDLLFNYQNNRLKESPSDPFSSAVFKKRCAILSLAHSSRRLGNSTSCHIFEDQLNDYFKLIDNRSGINNFAKATLDLVSNVKNVSKSWKSGLPSNEDEIRNLWKPLKGECMNPNTLGICSNSLPPPPLVKQLQGNLKFIDQKFVSKQVVQTTLDCFKQTHHGNSATSLQKKNSLFPSYEDIKTNENTHNSVDLKPKVDTFQTDIRKNKFSSLYSSYNDSRKPKQNRASYDEDESLPRQNYKFELNRKKKNPLHSRYEEQEQESPTERNLTYNQYPGGKGYYRNNKPLFSSVGSHNEGNSGEDIKDEFENHFKTAGQQLKISNQKKFGNPNGGRGEYERGNERSNAGNYERGSGFQPVMSIKKSLGGKRSVSSKFVPPVRNNSQEERPREESCVDPEAELDERLRNIEPRMVELIKNEIMYTGSKIDWDDIAGLQFAKTTIQEIVVWPMLRPDIFTGLRRPPKGILLFGPPGTGKTLIGKCIASQSNSTFFSISASSLTSKWIGDGEKMVRALFAVARCHQPAVVFIDEIDSLLSQRSDTEHESSRRIKTEFLVQLDGAATGEEDRILVIGATNRPQELDEAARRRLVKRLYIPLPDKEARKQLTQNLIKLERNDLSEDDIEEISCLTEGYSGADMKNLCQEASLGPIRSISTKDMFQISAEQVRPVNISDFKMALRRVKSSVSSKDLDIYLQWDEQYGSGAFTS